MRKVLDCLPVHPTFVKRTWTDAARHLHDEGLPVDMPSLMDEFRKRYQGNPDSVLVLEKSMKADLRHSIEVDGRWYNSVEATRDVASMFYQVASVVENPDYAISVLVDESGRRAMGTALYIWMCASQS